MSKAQKRITGGLGVVAAALMMAACSNPMQFSSAGQSSSARSISQSAPDLGLAASFAVFGGGAGVTNQGLATVINGDLGTTGASTMITGFHSPTFKYSETPLNAGAVSGLVYSNVPQGTAETFAYATSAASAVLPPDPIVVPVVSSITITGNTAANVVPVIAGSGFINVENNGGLVTVTENGAGTIAVVNNGGVLTATNTGNGTMTINSSAIGAVTVTNTGNGRVTVNATGTAAVTITHTGDEDYTYPEE